MAMWMVLIVTRYRLPFGDQNNGIMDLKYQPAKSAQRSEGHGGESLGDETVPLIIFGLPT